MLCLRSRRTIVSVSAVSQQCGSDSDWTGCKSESWCQSSTPTSPYPALRGSSPQGCRRNLPILSVETREPQAHVCVPLPLLEPVACWRLPRTLIPVCRCCQVSVRWCIRQCLGGSALLMCLSVLSLCVRLCVCVCLGRVCLCGSVCVCWCMRIWGREGLLCLGTVSASSCICLSVPRSVSSPCHSRASKNGVGIEKEPRSAVINKQDYLYYYY